MITVLVSGAAGRMGSEVVRAVSAEDDLRLVAAVDPAHAGEQVQDSPGLAYAGDLAETLEATRPDVMVDFTHPSVVAGNIETALARGVHCVVGTTGLPVQTLEDLAARARDDACLFVAPNFAIGAVLMMRFAAEAARFMPHVEIVELHHDRKADAPSGTALRTAGLIAAARDHVPESPGRETEIADGARGALVDDVTIHSVRLPGLVAHQEVLFGGQGQTLSLRHDSIDRTSFMPGVILAVRKVTGRNGLIVGLERLMEE
ncbi:4-hydroxy-tetrahydrodipicolinate reductase [Anaerosoma tenue]|uniref:4-hydroxy-tetrahydrodipicolinate reductase n=1 Tax=Anaerosoma tenue TaxID=2933588 RepID=UPI0022609891|nr:4-hydroxy-tetrahydrodipicolinate reductase [Anaerosoma tenue]MCK8114233.1 4-hydroxy-tetrahydrodipicolinate reductase [Anaerosoma tenue]